jgi:hypothetical protein
VPDLSNPSRAPNDDLRLKRSELAWEIRKYRLDARVRARSDAAQLALEQARLDLDKRKVEREDSFWGRLGPTIVTSVTAVLGALVGLGGVLYSNYSNQQAAERAQVVNASVAQSDGKKDATDQVEARNKILADNPKDVAAEIFNRLKTQSASSASRVIWDQGLQVAQSAQSVPASSAGTVYVHYKDAKDAAAVDAVIADLTKAGYYVPGKQQIERQTSGDVRYSAVATDTATKSKAENIATLVEAALKSAGAPHTMAVKNIHDMFPKAPSTTFEVWLPVL